MEPQNISAMLADYDQGPVENYISYLVGLSTEKKNNKPKNPWMSYKTDEYLATAFKKVALDGLVFDGEDITLQNTGISYSYQAYKNKMLIQYPESVIDVSIVHANDTFKFSKKSGHVEYVHNIADPFDQSEKTVTGAYCVIKNKRGEFLTLLSKADIDKHRKVAKTDYIWKAWFLEMAMKTIMKKACKQHFKDIYQNIETIDNENYDVDQPLGIEIDTKAAVEEINTLEELKKFYHENKNLQSDKKDFNKLISTRKEKLSQENPDEDL